MEMSFKFMLSVIFTTIITFIMIGLLSLFLRISLSKVELENIINTIEISDNYNETVDRLNDRSDITINEFDIGDKKQYYVELTSDYELIGIGPKHFKIMGYTKVLEM